MIDQEEENKYQSRGSHADEVVTPTFFATNSSNYTSQGQKQKLLQKEIDEVLMQYKQKTSLPHSKEKGSRASSMMSESEWNVDEEILLSKKKLNDS